MNVNFNNVRKKACLAYDNLVEKLNKSIADYNAEYSINGKVMINSEDIQQELDDLKQCIGTIAMCYEDENPDMIDVFEVLYPGRGESMVDFNPGTDE